MKALSAPSKRMGSAWMAGMALMATAMPAAAHPDIAITLQLLFNLRDGALTAIGESWTFDASYSRALLDRFDRDRDGAFGGDEKLALQKRLMADLGDDRFFTRLVVGGEAMALGLPVGFDAATNGAAITVTFALKLSTPVDLREGMASLLVRDESYTAAFQLADEHALLIRGDQNGNCRVRSDPAPDASHFADLVVLERYRLSCSAAD